MTTIHIGHISALTDINNQCAVLEMTSNYLSIMANNCLSSVGIPQLLPIEDRQLFAIVVRQLLVNVNRLCLSMMDNTHSLWTRETFKPVTLSYLD